MRWKCLVQSRRTHRIFVERMNGRTAPVGDVKPRESRRLNSEARERRSKIPEERGDGAWRRS